MLKLLSLPQSNLPARWMGRDGEAVACEEKVAQLNDSVAEIRALCQQALEDAVMMGCSEHFVRIVLQDMIASLEKPFSHQNA